MLKLDLCVLRNIYYLQKEPKAQCVLKEGQPHANANWLCPCWRHMKKHFYVFQDFTICEISVKLILCEWREDTRLDAGCIRLFSSLCNAGD